MKTLNLACYPVTPRVTVWCLTSKCRNITVIAHLNRVVVLVWHWVCTWYWSSYIVVFGDFVLGYLPNFLALQYCSVQNHPMSSSTRHCSVRHLCHCKSPQFKAFDLFINDSQMTLVLSVIFLSQLLQQYVFLFQGVSSHKYEFSGHLLSVLKIKAEMQWKRNEKKKSAN